MKSTASFAHRKTVLKLVKKNNRFLGDSRSIVLTTGNPNNEP